MQIFYILLRYTNRNALAIAVFRLVTWLKLKYATGNIRQSSANLQTDGNKQQQSNNNNSNNYNNNNSNNVLKQK